MLDLRSGAVDQDFRLGDWTVSPKLNVLSSNGKVVRVEPKVMQVLVCLAEAADVVSKQAIMRRVWADTFVTDDVLTRSISELRKVLADDPRNPQYIQTIPKGGYRLLAAVTPINGNGPAAKAAALPASMPPAVQTRLRVRAALTLLIVTAGAILAVVAWSWRPASPAPAAVKRNILAIVPFQDLNHDPEHAYYADGLTAEMISQLGRLPSDRLGVIAWSSMIRYKGTARSEDEIARELGANYILEGTVRRSGNQVRITAELIHVGERSHVWANSYDGDLSDVLALQNRVAHEIASGIRPQIGPEQEARLNQASPAVNAQGYEAYLKGRFAMEGWHEGPLRNRVARFEEAIRLNPRYAPPYVGLAIAYRQLASEGFASAGAYQKARSALDQALQIDPSVAGAHQEMGWVKWRGNWDFSGAEKEFRQGVELQPGHAGSHDQYSLYLKSMGRLSEALAQINMAAELSPHDPYTQANAGHLLAMMKRYDEAAEHFQKALASAPNEPYVHERFGAVLLWQGKNAEAISELRKAVQFSNLQPEKLCWLAYAYAVSNRKVEAVAMLKRLTMLEQKKQQYVSPFHMALAYTGLGDSENAYRWLEKAFTDHDEWLVYLHVYPEFQALREDARFKDLEHRLGLV